jgi:AAA15 family ATPase/GTPase
MYLFKFRILNYKSFRDSGILEFKPGINIIVGTNNSGKTALLEALSLNFESKIHKSLKNLTLFPELSNVINSASGYQLSLKVEKESILPFVKNLSQLRNNILIVLPDEYKSNHGYSSNSLKNFINDKNSQDIEIQMTVWNTNPIPFDSIPNFFSSSYSQPIEDLLVKIPTEPQSYYGVPHPDSEEASSFFNSFTLTTQFHFFQKYSSIIYKFNAERLNLATSGVGISRVLKSDASNLAEVILNIQSNYNLFKRFNKYVSMVIPNIKWVSASLRDIGTIQIKIWTFDPATEREDLAHSLSDCGTGVSQVLAILYVVITSQEPQTIIIDEPQSFLHPGAAKKLIEILKFKEFAKHQYFIATHSAEIITAANPSTITKLGYEEGETQISTMNAKDIKEQRSLLNELGVSLSDVFGADSILWVEGPTEELCFPLVLSKLAPELLIGTKIISVKQTGDLLGKKEHFANVMFDLYRRLSGGNNLSPPILGFVFDQENRDDQQMIDLQKRSSEPVYFLKKCMYENYLLHPNAITAILNLYDLGQQHPFTSETIQKGLETNKVKLMQKKDCFSKNATPEQLSNPQYIDTNINAAKLLSMLFEELSSGLLKFNKTEHSIMLTEWLLEDDPEQFVELVQFLRHIFDEGRARIS